MDRAVLVMREVTERQEGIDAGTALLVGTNKQLIIDSLSKLLSDPSAYEKMAKAISPYGDGTACRRIVDIVKEFKVNN